MALNTTVGDPLADSYADIAWADAYHVGHPQAATWTGASTESKEWALRMAARLMDNGIPWQGSAASETQALAFPRVGLLTRTGAALPSNVNPADLKNAQSEFARQLLESNRLEDNDAIRQGITELKIGSIGFKFRDDFNWDRDTPPVISDAVLALLVPTWWKVTEEQWIFRVV